MSAYPTAAFTAEVTQVRQLSRDFMRISLASEQLSGLAAPAGDGRGPVTDAYLKLLIPAPGAPSPVPVEFDETWRQRWFAASLAERGGWMRTYTLRAARPWTGAEGGVGVEIDVDLVLHGLQESGDAALPDSPGQAAGSAGPAARWAAAVQRGEQVTLLGPTREGRLWSSWNPQGARTVIICADESALPAAFSCLEDLPDGAQTRLILEIAPGNRELFDSLEPELRAASERGVVVEHHERVPGSARGEATLRALRKAFGLEAQEAGGLRGTLAASVPEPEEIVWGVPQDPSDLYVFLAGEASVVRAARRLCLREAGVERPSIAFMGYWKAGRAES